MNRHEQTLGPISIFRPPNSVPQLLIKEEENNIVDWQIPALKTKQRTRNEFKINMTLSCLYTHELRYKKCFSHTKRSTIIRNGNPNLASEIRSARGCHFTQPFTNNYALESILGCVKIWIIGTLIPRRSFGRPAGALSRNLLLIFLHKSVYSNQIAPSQRQHVYSSPAICCLEEYEYLYVKITKWLYVLPENKRTNEWRLKCSP